MSRQRAHSDSPNRCWCEPMLRYECGYCDGDGCEACDGVGLVRNHNYPGVEGEAVWIHTSGNEVPFPNWAEVRDAG
jgi:hypothetical protein